MAYLVLIRHGMSTYNAKGIWTGWANPDLTNKGIRQAKEDALKIKDLSFDFAFVSNFKRTKHTLQIIKDSLKQQFKITVSDKINERNYGDYTGKNKWQIEKEVGEKIFKKIRRSWDFPISNGESLKDVYLREIPYFKNEIEPLLKKNKNVIIISSGNALRVIVKYLEKITEQAIANLEIGLGEIYIYNFDLNLKIILKEIRAENKTKGKI